MRLGPLDIPAAIFVCRNLRAADVRELEATRFGELDRDELAVEIVRTWGGTYGWVVFDADGEPTAIFGATNPWPGMFSAFMVATDNFPRVGLGLTKFVKRIFIPHLLSRGHRVEARSIEGHDHAHKWLRALGATVEARHFNYGRQGEDFLVFTLAPNREAATVDRRD